LRKLFDGLEISGPYNYQKNDGCADRDRDFSVAATNISKIQLHQAEAGSEDKLR
jgi:hypothetical protein